MTRMPGDAEYVKRTWGVDPSHTYRWPCHAERGDRDPRRADPARLRHRVDERPERGALEARPAARAREHAAVPAQRRRAHPDRSRLFVNCYGARARDLRSGGARADPARAAGVSGGADVAPAVRDGRGDPRDRRGVAVPRPGLPELDLVAHLAHQPLRPHAHGRRGQPRDHALARARRGCTGCATTTARRSRRTATTSCATGSSPPARWASRKLEVDLVPRVVGVDRLPRVRGLAADAPASSTSTTTW